MLDPQEPPHMNISHKRNPSWSPEIIQEGERYGSQEGSTKQRKKPNPFPSYMDWMCDLVYKYPTCFEAEV